MGQFAIATSNGQVITFTITTDGTGPIQHIRSYQIFPESTIVLSLAWNRELRHARVIAASSSNGQIAVFDTDYDYPETFAKTAAHSLEAWTLAWSAQGEGNLYPRLYPRLFSGGDDSALCTHDLSLTPIDPSLNHGVSLKYVFQTPHQDTKRHMAGLTAILPLTLQPSSRWGRLLLTGSYDEYVRLLWPVDGSSRPRVLAEQRLGGGVWSLKRIDGLVPDGGPGKGTSEQIESLSNPVEALI